MFAWRKKEISTYQVLKFNVRGKIMKSLNVILFKDGEEIAKLANDLCAKLAYATLAENQWFCGIWEIKFNREIALQSISDTLNYHLGLERDEIYFGCTEKDYDDIIALIDREVCSVKSVSVCEFLQA